MPEKEDMVNILSFKRKPNKQTKEWTNELQNYASITRYFFFLFLQQVQAWNVDRTTKQRTCGAETRWMFFPCLAGLFPFLAAGALMEFWKLLSRHISSPNTISEKSSRHSCCSARNRSLDGCQKGLVLCVDTPTTVCLLCARNNQRRTPLWTWNWNCTSLSTTINCPLSADMIHADGLLAGYRYRVFVGGSSVAAPGCVEMAINQWWYVCAFYFDHCLSFMYLADDLVCLQQKVLLVTTHGWETAFRTIISDANPN